MCGCTLNLKIRIWGPWNRTIFLFLIKFSVSLKFEDYNFGHNFGAPFAPTFFLKIKYFSEKTNCRDRCTKFFRKKKYSNFRDTENFIKDKIIPLSQWPQIRIFRLKGQVYQFFLENRKKVHNRPKTAKFAFVAYFKNIGLDGTQFWEYGSHAQIRPLFKALFGPF